MKISFPGGKKVDINYKNFVIKTDQPIKYGGENSNPEPFSLFLSSIGACVGYYILSFCQERDINTKELKLIVKTIKNNQTNMIDQIDIRILAQKNFPDKYLKSIIKTANLCAVKKHLENPPKIEILINKVE